MHFKLFAIDKIEMLFMLKNMPVSRVCHITDSGTGRCTRKARNILLYSRNGMHTIINTV